MSRQATGKIHIKQNLYQGVTFHSLPSSELLSISGQRRKQGKEEDERGEKQNCFQHEGKKRKPPLGLFS